MRLSARSRYATRLLLELAKNSTGQPVSAATLAQAAGVSVQFIEQIFKKLKKRGLTKSVRGAMGGHLLAQKPLEISLNTVVTAVEGGFSLAPCYNGSPIKCEREKNCETRSAWIFATEALKQVLSSITIADLLKNIDNPKPEFAIHNLQIASAQTIAPKINTLPRLRKIRKAPKAPIKRMAAVPRNAAYQ